MTTTEMVNARSFIQIEKNLRHSPPRLWGIPTETRPVAVQIWDNVPENLAEVGRVLAQIWNVSVVDINFGCPSPTVAQRSQSGSYLLDFPEQVEKIVRLTVEACAPTPVRGWSGAKNSCEVRKVREVLSYAFFAAKISMADFVRDPEAFSAASKLFRRLVMTVNPRVGAVDTFRRILEASAAKREVFDFWAALLRTAAARNERGEPF